ncbi:hypothetical protein EDB85DRAFT_2182010 [Lactarius pseudohatsudake]|nr:hypothetical protein EDB85DRAFT_2182010 [Lactarius pseudohatsudake]
MVQASLKEKNLTKVPEVHAVMMLMAQGDYLLLGDRRKASVEQQMRGARKCTTVVGEGSPFHVVIWKGKLIYTTEAELEMSLNTITKCVRSNYLRVTCLRVQVAIFLQGIKKEAAKKVTFSPVITKRTSLNDIWAHFALLLSTSIFCLSHTIVRKWGAGAVNVGTWRQRQSCCATCREASCAPSHANGAPRDGAACPRIPPVRAYGAAWPRGRGCHAPCVRPFCANGKGGVGGVVEGGRGGAGGDRVSLMPLPMHMGWHGQGGRGPGVVKGEGNNMERGQHVPHAPSRVSLTPLPARTGHHGQGGREAPGVACPQGDAVKGEGEGPVAMGRGAGCPSPRAPPFCARWRREGSGGHVPPFHANGVAQRGNGKGQGQRGEACPCAPPFHANRVQTGEKGGPRRPGSGRGHYVPLICLRSGQQWSMREGALACVPFLTRKEERRGRRGKEEGVLDPVAEATCACHISVCKVYVPSLPSLSPSPFAKEDGPCPHPLHHMLPRSRIDRCRKGAHKDCQKTGCNWSLTGLLVGAQALPVSWVRGFLRARRSLDWTCCNVAACHLPNNHHGAVVNWPLNKLTTWRCALGQQHGVPLSYNSADSDTVPSHYDTVAVLQQHGDSNTVPARYNTIMWCCLAMTVTWCPATTTLMPCRHGTTATRRRATATPTPHRSNMAPACYNTDAWRHFATTLTQCPATNAALQQHGNADMVPASRLHRHAAPSHYDSDTAPCHYDTDATLPWNNTNTTSSHYNTDAAPQQHGAHMLRH